MALVVTSFNVEHPTSHALLTSHTTCRWELVCGACIGTAQVGRGASFLAPSDSFFRRSSLRSFRDIILVFVTWRYMMPVSTWNVHFLYTLQVYAVLFCLKYDATPIVLYVHPVSILLKIWWRRINTLPDSGVNIDQVRLHNRRVHVRAVPILRVSLKYNATPLVFCVHFVSIFPKNMMTMCQQFHRLRWVSPHGLGLVLLCCQDSACGKYRIVHGLTPPPFSHPDSLECW